MCCKEKQLPRPLTYQFSLTLQSKLREHINQLLFWTEMLRASRPGQLVMASILKILVICVCVYACTAVVAIIACDLCPE